MCACACVRFSGVNWKLTGWSTQAVLGVAELAVVADELPAAGGPRLQRLPGAAPLALPAAARLTGPPGNTPRRQLGPIRNLPTSPVAANY